MRYDFAPMEGITGALFRRLHHQFFPGVDRYYMPFLSPTRDHVFTPRELREILPENNPDAEVIPQLLTKVPEDFLWAAGELAAMGYQTVNLNLGCPSGTVVAKGKGSGMLADPSALDAFLDAVFSRAPCAVSVKTRLGLSDPEEFGPLLEIYNRYPLAELIVHPRVQKDGYRHPVRLEAFASILAASRHPVCFNGGLVTTQDCRDLVDRFSGICGVMIGQGLVANPALVRQIRGGPGADWEALRAFHEALFGGYSQLFGSAHNAMMRMKELWAYLIRLFRDSGPYAKRLRKARDPQTFSQAVDAVFQELELLPEADWGG